MKKIIPTLALSLLAVACNSTNDVNVEKEVEIVINTPKNIIMIVGDGMGPAYTSAYRYFSDNPTTPEVEETVFDRHLVGSSSTYPARVSGYVTDSAAGATALATGTKSYNGAIGVDVDKHPLESVLVWAKKQGKKTGMVVTSQINHATPASYLAHNESRHNYNEIADNFLASHDNIDVLMGGGWKYFIRDDQNLVASFQDKGFHYIDDYQQLESVPAQKKLLGLFADSGLPWALDDKNKHRLLAMTKTAIPQLENSNGYFMLIEASQIDWGGHANDVGAAMAEMDDLAKTMEFLEQYVANNPDTLVVLTADHSTGGFTIGQGGDYLWQPKILKTMTMSPSSVSEKFASNNITINYASELLNFTITEQELEILTSAKASGQTAVEAYKLLNNKVKKSIRQPSVQQSIYKALKKIIDKRTITGWTTGGHTGVDVPVFALGKGKDKFIGLSDNTEIAEKIFELLGKE